MQTENIDYSYFYDPITNTTNITDLVHPNTTNYTVVQYATVIKNNVFEWNMAGMKGSALLIQGISELIVEDNIF